MKTTAVLTLVLFGLAAWLAAPPAAAETLIVVLADRLPWTALAELGRPGALGLMSSGSAGWRDPVAAQLTLGAGGWLKGPTSLQGASAGEVLAEGRAAEVHARRMGRESEAAVLCLNLPQILSQLDPGSRMPPGGLGDALGRAAVPVAVWGNSDCHCLTARAAVGVAMDASGSVPAGDVARGTLPAADAPCGLATDYAFLLEVSRRAGRGLHLLETGDFARLDRHRGEFTPPAAAASEAAALRRLGEFWRQLGSSRADAFRLLLAPSPASAAAVRGELLVPVLLAGPGVETGFLSSASTRVRGVVAAVDVAPSLAGMQGVTVPGAEGRPWSVSPQQDPWVVLEALQTAAAGAERRRPWLVKGYIGAHVGLAAVSLLLFLRSGRPSPAMVWGLISLGAVPLACLLVARGAAFELVVFAVLWGALGALLRAERAVLAVLCLTTLAVIALASPEAMYASPLGFSPAAGARFYGVGNEFAGIAIGAGLALAALASGRPRGGMLGLPLVAAVAVWLGAPGLGANLGAAVAALAGGAAFACLDRRTAAGAGGRVPAVGLGLALLVLVCLIAWDAGAPDRASHVASLVIRTTGGDHTGAVALVYRKAQINLKLIRYTAWSRLFLGSLAVFGAWHIRRRRHRTGEGLDAGVLATVAAALMALCVNDSGVVAAATTMVFVPALQGLDSLRTTFHC
ncbi:MAG: hypothetical protein AB1492_05985 [Bacillota bacterium]